MAKVLESLQGGMLGHDFVGFVVESIYQFLAPGLVSVCMYVHSRWFKFLHMPFLPVGLEFLVDEPCTYVEVKGVGIVFCLFDISL